MNFFLFEDQEEMPKSLLDEEGKLFSTCKQCGVDLLDPPQQYTMEKVFKRYPNTNKPQVLFEYAICDNCTSEIREDFSEESALAMQQYFEQKLLGREEGISDDVNERLSNCMLANTSLEDEQEYAIVARGFGEKMLKSHYPFAIGVTAMDEIQDLISDKTRDLLDDFVGKNFPGPPEFEKVPVDGKWVLV